MIQVYGSGGAAIRRPAVCHHMAMTSGANAAAAAASAIMPKPPPAYTPPIRQQTIITTDPRIITWPRPRRSVIRPDRMEKANIPRVWAEITSDTALKGCWWAFMWTEVIDIGTIITIWAKTMLTVATITPGCLTTSERERIPCRGTDSG